MKKNFKWLLAIVAMVASVNVNAEIANPYSFTFTKGSLTTSSTSYTSGEVTWALSATENQWNGTANQAGYMFGAAKTPKTLTLSTEDIDGTITQITVTGRSNNKGKTAVVSVKVGESSFTTDDNSWDNGNNQTLTFTGSESGKIAITITPDSCGYIVNGVSVTYETSSSVTLDSLVIKGAAEKMEYEVGEAFDLAGLEVWGIYTKVMKHDSTSQIKSGITWTIDPETFAEISDNASVTLSASYKDQTTADTTITGIKVIPAVKRIETTIAFSNTLFGVAVGNNAKEQSVTKDTVTIVSGCKSTAGTKTSYQADHVRYYTDSYLKLSAPNGLAITKVEFKEKDTWNSDGLSANVGTYDAATKTWTGKNRSIEFSFSKQCRVGSIKVTCVETAPAAENPTITADTVADLYWEPFTVTLACETEGADIYYTLDGSEPTASATKYTAPFSVSATTTVKAIAVKEGLDNSEVASKIFSFGKVFDNIAACFADTTLQNGDVVKISNVSAVITSFAGSGKTVYFEGGSFYVSATYPEAYAIGGTLSGSNLQFTYMNYNPKQLRPASWSELTYSAPVAPADRRIFAYDLRMTEVDEVCTFAFKTNIAPAEANIVLYREGAIIDRKAVEVSEALAYSIAINKSDIAGIAGEKMAWGVEVKAGKVENFGMVFNEGAVARQRMFIAMDKNTESPYFGRIYSSSRATASDVKAVIYGVDGSIINGNAFTLGNAARPGVDAEGTIYWADYADAHSGIWVMNPETFATEQLFDFDTRKPSDPNGGLLTKNGVDMCGSTMCAEISGKGADTKLWISNEDAGTGIQAQGLVMVKLGQEDGSIAHTWAAAPTWAPTLSHNAGSCFDMQKTERGLWWCQNRTSGQNANANRSLMFINNDGEIKWVSDNTDVTINGSNGGGMEVNADESVVYMVDGTGNIMVMNIAWNEDVPTLSLDTTYETSFSHINTIILDPAGNLVTSSGAYGTNMRLVIYGMPTDNNEIIIPAAASQAIEFAAPSLADVLDGKTIRRAVACDDAVYVLAIDTAKVPTLVKADFEGNVVTTFATDFCTVSAAGAAEAGCMVLSDIALTADGVLVGMNADHAHTTKVTGTQPIIYKWNADGTGAIWIDTENLVGGNENFAAGNFGNATVDMIAYSGTIADGEIVLRAMTQGSGNRSRFGIMKIVEGAFSVATRNQDLNAFTATSGITLIAAPTKGNYIWGGAGIAPIEWTPAYTETSLAQGATPTLVGTMANDYIGIKDFSVAKSGEKDLMIIPAEDGATILNVTSGLATATVEDELTTQGITCDFMHAALVANGTKVMLMRDADIILLDMPAGPGTNLNEIKADAKAVKVMRNGHVFIIRDGKMFNMQGMIVK